MGETREERIEEFLEENDCPVLAMYEGSWLRVSGDRGDGHRARSAVPAGRGCEAFADGVDVSQLLDCAPVFDGGARPRRADRTAGHGTGAVPHPT